jgi:predicted dehydrogenase
MPLHSPLRWGVLGAARILHRMGPAFATTPGHQLIAVAGRRPAKLQEVGGKYPGVRLIADYDALLADPEIDAIYLPLPPSLHAEWGLKVAQAGKHLLIEKPVATSLADAEELDQAFAQRGLVWLDNTMWLHHPRTADMQQIIASGQLGVLARVTAAMSFNAKDLPPEDHRFNAHLGGGALLDVGWYCAGVCLWAFKSFPVEVWSQANMVNGVDRDVSAWCRFANGAMASFDASHHISMRRWFEVSGSEASMVCDDFTRPFNPEKVRFWTHSTGGKMAEHKCTPDTSEIPVLETFRRAIAGELNPRPFQQQALDTQRLVDTIRAAFSKNGAIYVVN